MARFFVSPDDIQNGEILLTGENAQHGKVLRLQPGELIDVCDGMGYDYRCAVQEIDNKTIRVSILEKMESQNEAAVRASVYISFPKADKLEHIIQKATELGAYEIVAFPSARCVSRPDEKSLNKKAERWQKIAHSAAEQSGRGRVPQILILPSYAKALERATKADKAILFYEAERSVTLKMALENSTFSSISLMTGPEGGLEAREVEQAREAGLEICTLGRRILRCETAPLCALSAVMFASGEF